MAAGLKPWRGSTLNVHASTGLVGQEASEYWGSNQAAAALAIWSRRRASFTTPRRTTCRCTCSAARPGSAARLPAAPLVHVHYHWLFTDPHHEAALAALQDLGAAPDRLEWLTARLPLR